MEKEKIWLVVTDHFQPLPLVLHGLRCGTNIGKICPEVDCPAGLALSGEGAPVNNSCMSDQIMRENLFVIAQTYATAKGLSLSTVSKQIHGNQAFLNDFLEGNASTTIRTYYGMIDKLRAMWPAGLKWPETSDIRGPTRTLFNPTKIAGRDRGGRFLGKKSDKRTAHA